MRLTKLIVVILAICSTLCMAPQTLKAQSTLNNDAVIKLVKAGLSEDLIISTINSQPGTYDISTDGLIALKSAGISDKVVSAIVMKVSGGAPAAASVMPTGVVGGNPDDPAAPHEAGIYIYNDSATAGSKMTMLEPSVYSQGKSGGFLASAMTYGIAKIKMKAVLRGAHANAQVSDPHPVFYFYFEEQGAGLSHSSTPFGGTSTPNEYTLLKFDVKGNTRETATGSFNAFGGSGGTDDKAVTNFTYTKMRPGVYKVIMNAALEPGEYGFISTAGQGVVSPYGGAAASSSRIFDFGRN
jgi:hypothetical protein